MSETKTLNPIVVEQIEQVQRRIALANRRIERHSRTEETFEIGEDENGKKTKTKKRVVSPEDKKIVARETETANRLRAVVEQMQRTNSLVFDKPAQQKLSAKTLAETESNVTVAAGVTNPRYARKK